MGQFASRRKSLGVVVFILFSTLLSFQNCSQVKFSSTPVEQQLSSVAPSERIQSISPTTDDSASVGKIKVLLVVDNSPTMTNSQANLIKNLNSLLGVVKNYDADVKVISTTLVDESCTGDGCVSQPVFGYYQGVGTTTIDGKMASTVTYSWQESSKNKVFTFTKNMDDSSKTALLNQIANRVKELGVRGIDNETPFAAFATQLGNYFKKGDKALIYVLTDENDIGSYASLTKPYYQYSATFRDSRIEPGLQAVIDVYMTGSGYCVQKNEIGQVVNSYSVMPMRFTSESECINFLANAKVNSPNCDWGPGYSHVQIADGPTATLDGKSLPARCDELKTTYKGIYSIVNCIAKDVTIDNDTVYEKRKSFFLGITESDLAISSGMEDFVMKKVRSKVDELFGSKYLIAASVNLSNQACSLNIGQTKDTFYSSGVLKYFPKENVLTTSICEANQSDAPVRKIATEFESKMNTTYTLSLASNEYVDKAVIVISGVSKELKNKIDYEWTQTQFKIINPEFKVFQKINLTIKRK